MKNRKQWLCCILAVAIAAGSAGCSNGSGSQSQTGQAASSKSVSSNEAGGSTSAASTAESTASEANPWDRYKTTDLNGRTITIAYNWTHTPQTTSEKLDSKKATKGELKDLANMKRIEKKYNCKIKYVNIPYDQLYKKLTASVMAGSPCADLINISASMTFGGMQANLIQCLDDIAPKNCDMFNDHKILLPVKFFGKTYAMRTYDVGTSGAVIGFNRDLIKKLGTDMPDDLYKNGKWNWDNFLKIAKAATQDTDGDGKIDQWGVGGIPYNLMSMFIASNDGCLFNEKTKKTGLDDPKTMKAFDFVNKLYNTDKVAYLKSVKANWWNDDTGADFTKGNIAMFYAELYMIPSGDNDKLKFKIGCVPSPQGPSGTGKGWFRCDGGVTIPTGVKDPQYVYQIFEELSNPYGADFTTRDREAKKYPEGKFPTEADVELYMKNSKELYKLDDDAAFEDYTMNQVVEGFIKDGKTPAQGVQQYKQKAQATIDKKLKGTK
jgi:multiple sugar transport system substrate-binding protein